MNHTESEIALVDPFSEGDIARSRRAILARIRAIDREVERLRSIQFGLEQALSDVDGTA